MSGGYLSDGTMHRQTDKRRADSDKRRIFSVISPPQSRSDTALFFPVHAVVEKSLVYHHKGIGQQNKQHHRKPVSKQHACQLSVTLNSFSAVLHHLSFPGAGNKNENHEQIYQSKQLRGHNAEHHALRAIGAGCHIIF